MLEGSGLLARACACHFQGDPDVMIHAAGVSNSTCITAAEFDREKLRLMRNLSSHLGLGRFIYFSTCSVDDPHNRQTPYVKHKLAMEDIVKSHPRHLIVRLPQLAGRTPNPHTLLNYLYARIARSEQISIWEEARRNILDVDHVAQTVAFLAKHMNQLNTTINIANTRSHSITEIVSVIAQVVGKPAIIERRPGGSAYAIDTSIAAPIMKGLGIQMDRHYLHRVVEKYYGS